MNLFHDGFGHLATAALALKYESPDPFHIVTTGGRYGANALSAASNAATAGTFKVLAPGTPYEGICGFNTYYDSLGVSTTSFPFFLEFAVWNGATPLLTFVVMDSANGNGTLRVYRGSYTGTLLGTTSAPVVAVSTHMNVQIRWRIDPTNGEVEIRDEDNAVVLLLMGVNTGSTAWDRIGLWPGPNEKFSHLWVNDRAGARNTYFLGPGARVVTGMPDGNGSVAWTPSTGSNYQTVDEATPNADTDYNSAVLAPLVDRYAIADFTAFDTVHAVQANAIARKVSSAHAPTLSHVAVQGGVDYLGSVQALPLAYTDLRYIWDVNPATGLPWTIAEINAGEFGVRRVA